MADFILGQPPVVTFTGTTITFTEDELDPALADSMTTSDYVVFTTTTPATFAIATAPVQQADGTWDVVITGSLAAYTSGVDRAMVKVGSSVSAYTVMATAIAAMNGTTDRLLVCYADTSDNLAWVNSTIASSTGSGYSVSGVLPYAKIQLISHNDFYTMTGDMSSVVNVVLDNFTWYAGNGGNAIHYAPSTDLTGTFTIRRIKVVPGRGWCILNQGGNNKMQIFWCEFPGGYTALNLDAITALENCTFAFANIDWQNLANTAKNCQFICCNHITAGSVVPTTCLDTAGTIGDSGTLAAMKTWFTESSEGAPQIYFPAKSDSSLLGSGTNGSYAYDINGKAVSNGSYPIGCSLQFNMVALNDIIKSSDFVGNWDDDNLTDQTDFTNNVKLAIVGGLSWTGAYDPAGSPPAAANLNVVDQADGSTAVATISGGDALATYTIWTTKNATRDWTNSGSRVGDGDVTLTLGKGEYIAVVIGGTVAMSVGQAGFFWVSAGSLLRTRTRARTAKAALRAITGGGTSNAKGVQITYSAPGLDDVTVWAMDMDFRQTTKLRQTVTDEYFLRLLVPRQTGFPPAAFKVGTTITHVGEVLQVDDVEGNKDLSATFILNCSKFGDTPNY